MIVIFGCFFGFILLVSASVSASVYYYRLFKYGMHAPYGLFGFRQPQPVIIQQQVIQPQEGQPQELQQAEAESAS